jgi:CubicO group peptidase (beta-lactamase class C family)
MGTGGLSAARLGRLHEVMAGYVERSVVPGLVALVSRRGETHVDVRGSMAVHGTDSMRRDTLFRIASLTKPITAAAAMILVEECVLRLDAPVDPWLPELADRRVLRTLDSLLDDTVPAQRPITLRDLLTMRLGIGLILAPPDQSPIQRAIADADLAPGPNPPTVSPDEWMARLGGLPLLYQPGERWLYHTAYDVLGVLIARASGQTLEMFLRERLFEPLGMTATSFAVPADRLDRLPPSYLSDGVGGLAVHDDPRASRWGGDIPFEAGGGGLVSTIDDYHAFYRMLLRKGRHEGGRVLSRPSIELMTMDHLTPAQKAGAEMFFGDTRGWGFGVGVTLRRDDLAAPGSFGWTGGTGTIAAVDPQEDLIGILLTQRLMDSPAPPPVFSDFWTLAHAAIDD